MRHITFGRRHVTRGIAVVVCATVAGTALALSSAAAKQPRPRFDPPHDAQPWIAYQGSLRGQTFGTDGIFLVRADGSADHEIATALPGQHIHPDWSPDGRSLVFRADVGDQPQLFLTSPLTDPTGQRAQQLTSCAGDCVQVDDPAISPDGTHVAYIADTGLVTVDQIEVPASFDLVVGRITPRGLTDLRTVVHNATRPSTHLVNELLEPRWSPDGRTLVYWSDQTDGRTNQLVGTTIFTVGVDGSRRRQITSPSLYAGEVDWSPDGSRLVFVTHPLIVFNFDAVVSNLYTSRPDGTGIRQLTHATTSADRATQARWTPDGHIIYTRVTSAGRALWLIDRNGENQTPVAPGSLRTHGDVQPVPRNRAVGQP